MDGTKAFPIFIALLAVPSRSAAQDDVANVPAEDIKIGGDATKRYFLIGAGPKVTPPKEGFGLVVVLPGGEGNADFLPFVKRIFQNALDKEWLVAQPVAVKWSDDQVTIWPTEKNRVPKMKFTTEAFVEEVVADASKKQKVDPTRVLVLAWSSSGPAAYSISLQKKKSVTGFYVAMSVFRTEWLPDLAEAKDEAYFLDHSPQDQTCPFKDAEKAKKTLAAKGAKVELVTYEGGHGWTGDVFGRIRKGIGWLDKNRNRAAASRPAKGG